MKKLYYFFVNGGKVLFIYALLFVISISLYSLTIKGEVNYGNRCEQEFDDSIIRDYEYQGIVLKDGSLKCNTYYAQYLSELDEKENIIFLVSIAKLLEVNKSKVDFQVTIKCDEYQLMSSIVDYTVTYTKTYI